jgi:hypothetical protein
LEQFFQENQQQQETTIGLVLTLLIAITINSLCLSRSLLFSMDQLFNRLSKITSSTTSPGTFSYSYSSTTTTSDGHTEQYVQQSYSDNQRGLHQRQSAYSNSRTGDEKYENSRILKDQGIQKTLERNAKTRHEKTNEILKGIHDDESRSRFEQDWGNNRKEIKALQQSFREEYIRPSLTDGGSSISTQVLKRLV